MFIHSLIMASWGPQDVRTNTSLVLTSSCLWKSLTCINKEYYLIIGIHIHFFSQLSVGQVCLVAYLCSYNFGYLDKSAELIIYYKRIVKKLCATWTFLIAYFLLPLLVVRKTVCLRFPPYKAVAPASLFYFRRR